MKPLSRYRFLSAGASGVGKGRLPPLMFLLRVTGVCVWQHYGTLTNLRATNFNGIAIETQRIRVERRRKIRLVSM